MFEQDYIMRLIHEIIRTLLKLLFHIDTEHSTADLLEDEEQQTILEALLNLVDEGNIDEAENRLYDIVGGDMPEHANKDMGHLEMALLFYSYLNDKDDEFLQEHNFSREEIKQGVKNLISDYGLSGMAELFLL